MRRISSSYLYLLLGLAALGSRVGWAAPQRAAAEIAVAEGLIAFQSGDDSRAVERFKAAEELNREEGSPHYWRGLALLRLGRAREAAAEIEASLQARRSPEVAPEQVRMDLAAARQAVEGAPQTVKPPAWRPAAWAVGDRGLWEGTAGLLAAKDTNPNLFSKNLSLPAPGGHGLVRGEEGDALGRAGAGLGIYPFHALEQRDLSVTLEIQRSLHHDFGFLNLGLARGAVQLAFGSDPLGYLQGPLGSSRVPFGDSRRAVLLQAGGTVYRLGGDSYLRSLGAVASATFREWSATATRFDLAYLDRSYSSHLPLADPRRSGQDLSLQVNQLFYFGRRDRSVRLGVLVVDRQSSAEFRGSSLGANAELAWPLIPRWTVGLEGSVRKDEYDQRESNLFILSGPRRDDTTARAAATVLWEATTRLRWTLRGAWVRRTSNVDLGDGLPDLGYRRKVVSAGVSWVF